MKRRTGRTKIAKLLKIEAGFFMIRRICLVGALIALTGCGAGKPPEIGLAPTVQAVQADAMPVPGILGPDGKYLYALGPLDKLQIEVTGMPDSRREVTVDAQGFLAYPMAGSIEVAGLTPSQVSSLLERRMRENFVRDPKVQVNLVESTSNTITLDGAVRQPGVYPVYRGLSLMQAVAQAGGESNLAQASSIMLIREVDNAEYIGIYDLRAIRYGNYDDPEIYPGDKIVIDESRTLRLLDTLQGVTNLLTTPIIILSRQL